MDASEFLSSTLGIDAAEFARWLALAMLATCPIAYFGVTNLGGANWGKLHNGTDSSVSGRFGFTIMESTAFLCVPAFLSCANANSIPHRLLLFGYIFHYINRTFIYPAMMINPRPIPVQIAASAFVFNIWNGTLQGMYIGTLNIEEGHFYSIQFILGLFLFISGFYTNNQCDAILRGLRRRAYKKRDPAPQNKDDEFKRYSIPYGNMYDYVSYGNYFGEILEWGGFALLTGSFGAFAFFLFTISNLVPKAVKGHEWYKKKFPTYPPERKAIIPFLI